MVTSVITECNGEQHHVN